jgi:radical SAM superfamily enzyme
VVVHIINGLPDETKEMMLETVKYLMIRYSRNKDSMLYITKGTGLDNYYNKNKFKILSKDEYIDIVCDQLEVLNDNIVIHRITGDPKKEDLVAPLWLTKKFVVLNDIDKELKRRDSYQGIKNRTV